MTFNTFKKVIRVVSILCFVMFFLPMFFVSCGGEKVAEVSALRAATGYIPEMQKAQVSATPHWGYWIIVIISLILLLMTFMKSVTEKALTMSASIGLLLLLVVYIVFHAEANQMCRDYNCALDVTFWYVLNMIMIGISFILSVVRLFKGRQS